MAGRLLTHDVVSVYRPARELYDYYTLPRGVKLQEPRGGRGHPVLGNPLEALLPLLPAGARKIGSGKRAMGRIAVEARR